MPCEPGTYIDEYAHQQRECFMVTKTACPEYALFIPSTSTRHSVYVHKLIECIALRIKNSLFNMNNQQFSL